MKNNSFALFAGWLIDGTGETVRSDVLLEVENGRIANLRRVRQCDPMPPGVMNLARCTVLPGLLDCHVHLCLSGTGDQEIRRRQLSFGYAQARQVIHGHLIRHLSHGIVALRDAGDYGAHSLRYRTESLPDSRLPVTVKSPGKAWRAHGRYGRLIGRPPADGQSLAASVAKKKDALDHIKIINSGLNSLTEFGKETRPQFNAQELAAAFQKGLQYGLKSMVHANGTVPVRLALEAGCSSIEHGFFMGRENLEWMAERQVFWVPTAYSMKAYCELLGCGSPEAEIARKNLEDQLQQLARARDLGVPVVLGTDSGGLGIHHGRAFAEELRLFMEAGFSLEGALRCATLEAARLLGMENELGQLKRGMPATFIVTKGSPSSLPDALSAPEMVYVQGALWERPSEVIQKRQPLSMHG